MQIKLPFFTLLLLISFASVNAVLFTPALPDIAQFFSITNVHAEETVTWFLIGYALGQLLYGPVANRFGRKPVLYAGISVQIASSLLAVISGSLHAYWLLVIARFLQALGAGVGLKMTFTLVNEGYDALKARQTLSSLMLAFAITPGLSVALGGFLNARLGWMSCFYASAFYGGVLLLLVKRIPETLSTKDHHALKLKYLLNSYYVQFKNNQLIAGGLLMGGATCFVYVFAATAPFYAINRFGLTSTEYGLLNLLPPIGLIFGSIVSKMLAEKYSMQTIIKIGILLSTLGTLVMLTAMYKGLPILYSLFFPMIVIYFGLCFILANASVLAMSAVEDKGHGSAVMNFVNMGLATVVVLTVSLLPLNTLLLPALYMALCITMMGIFKFTDK